MMFVRALVFDYKRARFWLPPHTVAVGEPALSFLTQMHPLNPGGGAITTRPFKYGAEMNAAAEALRTHLPFFVCRVSRCTTTNRRSRLAGQTARGTMRSKTEVFVEVPQDLYDKFSDLADSFLAKFGDSPAPPADLKLQLEARLLAISSQHINTKITNNQVCVSNTRPAEILITCNCCSPPSRGSASTTERRLWSLLRSLR